MGLQLVHQVGRVVPVGVGGLDDLAGELVDHPAAPQRGRLRPEDRFEALPCGVPVGLGGQRLAAQRVVVLDHGQFGRGVEDGSAAHPHPVVHLGEGGDDEPGEEVGQATRVGLVGPVGERDQGQVPGDALGAGELPEVVGPVAGQLEVRLLLLPEAQRSGDALHELAVGGRDLHPPVARLGGGGRV